MWPNEECVIYVSEPADWLVVWSFEKLFFYPSHIKICVREAHTSKNSMRHEALPMAPAVLVTQNTFACTAGVKMRATWTDMSLEGHSFVPALHPSH